MPERTITKIEALPKLGAFSAEPARRKKVAAYARVSTDHEEQETSFEAQKDYYEKLILGRPDWELVKIYADQGISAAGINRRKEFSQMIEDCEAGLIDIVLVKSLSRFARNTVDSLVTIRRLKELGIGIWFEKENIWTFDSKGELLISIMSSLAQEESRSISENVTWGQRKRFADGKVSVAYSTFLGYDKGEDGNLVINKEQAVTVRLIFKLFLEGMTPNYIAKELTDRGIKTPMGKSVWNPSTVRRCLENEKMKGDALLQKEFTVDFLTKKHRKNEGQVPQYYVSGNHEPIISPAVFDMVQAELEKRSGRGSHYSGVNIFSSKIRCGECGSWFGSKVWHSNDKYRKVIYRCNMKYGDGHKCATPALSEADIKQAFLKAVNSLIGDREKIAEGIDLMRGILCDTDALEEDRIRLENEISVVRELTKGVVAEAGGTLADQKKSAKRYDELAERYQRLNTELEDVSRRKVSQTIKAEALGRFKDALLGQEEVLREFDEDLWGSLVDYVTVHSKKKVVVVFRDGTEIEVGIE